MGYVLCGILMILCILLVITSSAFGAKKTVDIFGMNIYIVDNDDIPSTPNGSAVLVQKSTASDLEEGKLILYLKSDADDEPTLGYIKEIAARDGVHYITVSYRDATYELTESKLVGRADYSSKFWGGVIRFIKTPLGVMIIAVLPCASLILYDIIRAAAANRPEPEVVPKVKNADEEHPHTDVKLSVDTEGKALYSKDRSLKPLPKDSSVLFNYSGKQKDVKKEPAKSERPIIPLTDKKPQTAPDKKPQNAPKSETSEKTGKLFDVRLPSNDFEHEEEDVKLSSALKTEATAIKSDPQTPANTNTGRYSQNTEKPRRESIPVKTAEIPVIAKKPSGSDAFFAQPSAGRQIAPQIGRQRRPQPLSEDEALVSRTAHQKTEKTAGKRSTQILASKSFDDLLSDDDDFSYSGGINDKAVDDILAGIDHKKYK